MKVNIEALRTQVATARREWEELPTEHTSYAMRHAAEMRYLSLKRLLQDAERPVQQVQAGTPPRTAQRWKAQAERAARA